MLGLIANLRQQWLEFRLAMLHLEQVGEIDRHRTAMTRLDERRRLIEANLPRSSRA